MLNFCKENADTSKIKEVLVLKGFLKCVCTKNPTQIRVQTGKLQIFHALQTTFNFAYKEDKDFSTYYAYFMHSSNIDAKRLLLSASPNSKLSSKRFKSVDWIMLSLIKNINSHFWGVVSTSAHKVLELLLALDDVVTLERKKDCFFTKHFSLVSQSFHYSFLFKKRKNICLLLEKGRKMIFVYF